MGLTTCTSFLTRLGRGVLLSALAVTPLLAPVGGGTRAAAQVATTYSSNKRVFKVGILLLDSTMDANLDGSISPAEAAAGPENPDPFVFYIADARSDVKPQNWEFINPLSPKTVTNDIFNRWTARDPSPTARKYQIGQQVTKDMACYWEVSLTDTPIADLLQYDLLFITNHRRTRLSPADREKLRKLVDAGGIVWFEDCGGLRMDSLGPFFLDQLQFNGGRPDSPAPSGVPGPIVNVPNHPLLTAPYPLTLAEVANLGDKNYSNYALVNLYDASLPPNPEVLVNVVGNAGRNGLPYIAAGTYGSGRVIATAGDSGCDINDYAGGSFTSSGGNSGAYCGENILTAHTEDLKFLYNVAAWGSSNSQYRKDPRRTASSFDEVGAPLIKSFDFADALTPATSVVSSSTAPLVYKNVVYVSGQNGGNATVRAYNAHPSLATGDLGLPDLSLGLPYDELWRWDGGGSGIPSTPILGTVFNFTAPSTQTQYADYLFVTLADGTLVRLSALASDAFGNVLPLPTSASNPPAGPSAGTYTDANGVAIPAPAPVFHENKLYVVEPNGLVRCIDANTLTTLWVSYSATQDPTYKPIGTPTLGYSRLGVTGGAGQVSWASNSSGNTNDLMLYVPVCMDNPSGGKIMRIMAYWLGTRHEVVTRPEAPGKYRTRAAIGAPAASRQYVALPPSYPNPTLGFPYIMPVVRVYTNTYDGGGNLVATAQDNMNAGNPNTGLTGKFTDDTGMVDVVDGGNNPPAPNLQAIVSVDYDVTYINLSPSRVPPALNNNNTNAARNVVMTLDGYLDGHEGLTMTSDDILVYAGRLQHPNGTRPLTVIQGDYEQYALGAKLRQSFSIFEAPGGIAPIPIENGFVVELPTLRNRLQFLSPLRPDMQANRLGGYEGLQNVVPVGPPVATNEGVAYVLARATSGVNGVVTVLMAFDMRKELVLTLPEAYNSAYRVKVQQFDAATFPPASGAVQPVTGILPPSGTNPNSISPNFVGDASRGRIVVSDMRINGRRFSSSQSFLVTYVPAGGTADKSIILTPTPVLPDEGPGSDVDTRDLPQIINGSYTPLLWFYVLPGVPTAAPTLAGDVLYLGVGTPEGAKVVAVDANPASTDPSIRPGLGEQVINVVSQLDGSANKINHVRWTQVAPGPITAPPVGSQGVLAINTAQGTAAYESGVTLIADAKRIIEVNAGGAALWTLDGTLDQKVVGGELPLFNPFIPGGIENAPANGRVVNDKKPLSRPSVARRLSPSDYLVSDTGNNRVVRVDRTGRLRWQLDRVNDPFELLASTDSLTLNGPTDVQLYLMTTPNAGNVNNPPIGYEAHYLIADAGNNRVLEVVDYFDQAGRYRNIQVTGRTTGTTRTVRGEQVVVWVSRTTSAEGRDLRFQSLQRVLSYGDPTKGQNGALFGYPSLVAVVGNATAAGNNAAGTQADFTGGSLVLLDYNPVNSLFPLTDAGGLSAGFWVPWAFTGNGVGTPIVLGAQPRNDGLVGNTLNEMILPTGERRRVSRPTYFQQITLPDATSPVRRKNVFLICDSNGVYQVNAATRRVEWFFAQDDYNRINEARLGLPAGSRPQIPFLPTSVKRLPNGDYLITNAWAGQSGFFGSGQFVGEVFQITGDRKFDAATGAQLDGVAVPLFSQFAAPNIVLTRDGTGTVVRRDQRMGSATSNTNLLEHPLFGDRL